MSFRLKIGRCPDFSFEKAGHVSTGSNPRKTQNPTIFKYDINGIWNFGTRLALMWRLEQ
jgi:hypothetical protein